MEFPLRRPLLVAGLFVVFLFQKWREAMITQALIQLIVAIIFAAITGQMGSPPPLM
jgi:uncharacterized membrane protein